MSGEARSLTELAQSIFPGQEQEDALQAVSVLLAVAPFARSRDGSVLFPARMHMLFRGLKGIYACTNPECGHSHSDGALHLGEIYLSDGKWVCPVCGSTVYELYNDRAAAPCFSRDMYEGGYGSQTGNLSVASAGARQRGCHPGNSSVYSAG